MTIVACLHRNRSGMDYHLHLRNEAPISNSLQEGMLKLFYRNQYFQQQQYAMSFFQQPQFMCLGKVQNVLSASKVEALLVLNKKC